MPTTLRIYHETTYRYINPVVLGNHKLLIRPRDGHDLKVDSSKLEISPSGLVSWHRDELDNSVALVTFESASVNELNIISEVTVSHYLSERAQLPLLDRVKRYPFVYTRHERTLIAAYLKKGPSHPTLDHWLENAVHSDSTPDILLGLCDAIYHGHQYQARDEEGVQHVADTIDRGRGSCRDYAWLFVVATRKLGFASRFVSGYFHTAGTPLLDGATHAWAEVYLPGAGWTGYDPTCNRMAAENHIPVSVAVNPEDIPPVSGLFTGPAGETPQMTVRVNVTPL